jgi:hypothetical protein
MWGLLVRGLIAAAGVLRAAVRSPAARRAAVQAAQKARRAFDSAKTGARQLCLGLRGRSLSFSQKQLQKKFKHARDFGVDGNYSPTNAEKFRAALEEHVANPATRIIKGSYRGKPVTHYVNPNNKLNVVKDASGQFESGWKLNDAQLNHVLSHGNLGGG